MHLANTLNRNIFYQYLLQMATYLFPFITLPYLTRVLGPDAYAVRSYAISVMGIVTTFVSYGFNNYGTREVARHRGDRDYICRLTTMICLMRLGLAAAGAIIVVSITPFIPLMAANPSYMLVAYFGACLTAMLPDFVFQGLEDMSVLTTRYVVSRLVSIVLIYGFIHGPEDIILVAVFEAVASLVAFAWSWADVVRVRGIHLGLGMATVRLFIKCFKSSTVFFISQASTTIFSGLTTVMIGVYIADAAKVSYWSLAMTAVQAVQALYNPIVNSLYPHVVVSHDLKPTKRLLMIGMPLVILGCFAFWLLSDYVMLVLGGESYIGGSGVVRLVTPVLLFSFPAVMLGFPVLAAVGRERWLTASSLVSAAFHVVGLIILAIFGRFTIPAVAILRSCTELVLMLTRVYFVAKWRRGCLQSTRDGQLCR